MSETRLAKNAVYLAKADSVEILLQILSTLFPTDPSYLGHVWIGDDRGSVFFECLPVSILNNKYRSNQDVDHVEYRNPVYTTDIVLLGNTRLADLSGVLH